mgnify:CR=1 FL=1|tara:strand:+ start:147 stop:656 length:510 start_codon:yes stop_codon:yes gene_type:complete
MDMSSKRGVVITVAILIAITIASFSVWIGNNTTNTEMTIVVTDFENHDVGIVDRHKIVSNSINESFGKFMDGEIEINDYDKIAKAGSSQNNALLIELKSSGAPEEWQETYVNRILSLKAFGEYIRETMVMINLIENEGGGGERIEILNNIEKLKEEYIQYGQMADSSKP